MTQNKLLHTKTEIFPDCVFICVHVCAASKATAAAGHAKESYFQINTGPAGCTGPDRSTED